MVDYYGWDDEHGRISFRHTISGPSPRGFRVENAEDRITIRNEQHPEGPVAHWLHNTLFNAFSAKLRRLIVVDGEVLADPRRVTFKTATAYWEPDTGISSGENPSAAHVSAAGRAASIFRRSTQSISALLSSTTGKPSGIGNVI